MRMQGTAAPGLPPESSLEVCLRAIRVTEPLPRWHQSRGGFGDADPRFHRPKITRRVVSDTHAPRQTKERRHPAVRTHPDAKMASLLVSALLAHSWNRTRPRKRVRSEAGSFWALAERKNRGRCILVRFYGCSRRLADGEEGPKNIPDDQTASLDHSAISQASLPPTLLLRVKKGIRHPGFRAFTGAAPGFTRRASGITSASLLLRLAIEAKRLQPFRLPIESTHENTPHRSPISCFASERG
jgi:hypothetical protein